MPPPDDVELSQAAIENTIASAKAAIPNSLYAFFIKNPFFDTGLLAGNHEN
jgi:hypothetical protein